MPSTSRQGRIVLVGPMGCGKSTIGRRLSELTDLPFVDLDDYIVFHAGCSIPSIFRERGEAAFRDLETQALEECLGKRAVIATGGGAVVRPRNQELISGSGLVVYLHASVEAQHERTSRDNGRPMLAVEDRLGRLREIFAQREPIYRALASFTVDTDRQGVDQCAAAICRAYQGQQGD
ncbi:MAG: shikimate kinase [Succinivibrionaceae bacterium]|nr:shikimate kinase [Succinivibrionaceae bacterium]